jgi:hypothetical protein
MLTKKQFDDSVTALRSGKYKQTHEPYLRMCEDYGSKEKYIDDCFCALGVIADVVDPNKWDQCPHNKWLSLWAEDAGELSADVLPWSTQWHISNLNNDQSTSFLDIANWMVKNEELLVE